MGFVGTLRQIGSNQKKNLGRVLSGLPVMTPSLGSMTLDEDDVLLAKNWINDRSKWNDAGIVRAYENEFCRWNGSKYAFAFMGGRVALSAAIFALNLKASDEVIIPGYTCVVVPNAFRYAGARVVYADIELETYGLDIESLERKISPKTRAIVVQHLFGLVSRDFEAILALAKKRGIAVIEDCAHAAGAEYRGRKVGNFGDIAFYSTEQSKIFNTIQGGIAVTNNDVLAVRLAEFEEDAELPDGGWIDRQLNNVLLNYYQQKHPNRWFLQDMAELKYGAKRLISTTAEEMEGRKPAYYGRKMPAPIAALGSNQLKKVDRYNEERRGTAKRWDRWCEKTRYVKPAVIKDSMPVFLRYPVLVEPEKKRDLSWAIRELGVTPGVWFMTNIHPAKEIVPDCPNANRAVERCINLPTLMD